MDADQGFMVDRLRMELGLETGWAVAEIGCQGDESRVLVHNPDGRDLSFSWGELFGSKQPTQFVRDRFAV